MLIVYHKNSWTKMFQNGLNGLKMKFVLNIKQALGRTTADQAKMPLFCTVANNLLDLSKA